jgi:hypothetical protein
LEKHRLGKLFPRGIVFPICSFRNSTPGILKGGPCTMLARGHHLRKWVKDFVERMVIHNAFVK